MLRYAAAFIKFPGHVKYMFSFCIALDRFECCTTGVLFYTPLSGQDFRLAAI